MNNCIIMRGSLIFQYGLISIKIKNVFLLQIILKSFCNKKTFFIFIEDVYKRQLINELNDNIIELENIIKLINKTNSSTYVDNESISDIIAKRDALGLKISILRSFVSESADRIDRYSNKEIKILSTVNVAEMQKQVDNISKEYRLLDTKLQGLNWTTDIIS